MLDRNKCVSCTKLSPEVESEFTLVSPQVGWRISRTVTADGTYIVEWRCPDCWRKFREQKASKAPPLSPATMPPASSKPTRGR